MQDDGNPHSSDPAAAAPDESAAPAAAPAHPPVLLIATDKQAKGARLRVAGLTVLERAIKQLVFLDYAQIIVATDGTCPLPAPLPDRVLVRTIKSSADLTALRGDFPGLEEFSADVVRPRNRDLKIAVRVADERSRRQAEDAIFAELKRGDLGLVARHLNKPLSFWFTRNVLCQQPFTPNQVTLAAGVVGLVGVVAVAMGSYGSILFGLLLAHLQSVLDGCDGELARVRFQQSAIGEWLDTVVDDALNLCLFLALAIGVSGATGSGRMMSTGLLAAGALAFYNVVAYRELIRQGEGGEVLKIRWWFAKGTSLKDAFSGWGRGQFTAKDVLLAAGRRDFFLFAWLVFALLSWHRLIVLYALTLGLINGFAAAGQLLTARSRAMESPAEPDADRPADPTA